MVPGFADGVRGWRLGGHKVLRILQRPPRPEWTMAGPLPGLGDIGALRPRMSPADTESPSGASSPHLPGRTLTKSGAWPRSDMELAGNYGKRGGWTMASEPLTPRVTAQRPAPAPGRRGQSADGATFGLAQQKGRKPSLQAPAPQPSAIPVRGGNTTGQAAIRLR